MQSSEIKAICQEIRDSLLSNTEKENFFKDKYSDFFVTYPTLFEAALNPDFPLFNYLDYMLSKKDELEEMKTTVEEADKEVYGTLNKEYVDPYVSQPTETQ